MHPRVIRRLLSVVFVGGVAGMIAMSIADNDGAALTFGLLCATAAVCLIAITSVGQRTTEEPVRFDDRTAEVLEARIAALVDAGADEEEVRDLVRMAVRLGNTAR